MTSDFSRYPTHHYLGIIDKHDEADAAVEELRALELEDVRVLRGADGADALDSDGRGNGMLSTLVRAVQAQFAEMDNLEQYERAVREGSTGVATRPVAEGSDERVEDVLRAHDARFVNYFGVNTVELKVR